VGLQINAIGWVYGVVLLASSVVVSWGQNLSRQIAYLVVIPDRPVCCNIVVLYPFLSPFTVDPVRKGNALRSKTASIRSAESQVNS
jgi:hypothetical protein